METNKLLTLEEIEELRIVNSLTDADARADLDSLMARLLATARAYWEMKNQYDIITSEFDSSGRFINKPHPATLKVIEGYNEEKNIIARGCPTMSEYKRCEAAWRLREIDKAISAVLVKPLEKHLE